MLSRNGDEYAWITAGCKDLDAVLTAAQVKHTTIGFEGTHDGQVSERLSTSALPFFEKVLKG